MQNLFRSSGKKPHNYSYDNDWQCYWKIIAKELSPCLPLHKLASHLRHLISDYLFNQSNSGMSKPESLTNLCYVFRVHTE